MKCLGQGHTVGEGEGSDSPFLCCSRFWKMPVPAKVFGALEGAHGGFEYKSEIIKGLC